MGHSGVPHPPTLTRPLSRAKVCLISLTVAGDQVLSISPVLSSLFPNQHLG